MWERKREKILMELKFGAVINFSARERVNFQVTTPSRLGVDCDDEEKQEESGGM